MIKVAIIGGKLQGVEACYLAKKSGFFSVLVDKNENPPARGLCDSFINADVLKKDGNLITALINVDLVLPALEDDEALDVLHQLEDEYELTMAFDFEAYTITSSKKRSDLLFHENGIPAPAYYPHGLAPYIAKPVYGSGSANVKLLETSADATVFLNGGCSQSEWVVQEYLSGRSYSIEVIGKPGCYRTYQITEIHVDKNYDCRLVTCPCNELTDTQKADFSDTAIKLAELLQLRGIMDVEAILDNGVMKILEIDARLPSQTPTAVYRSTGINFLGELYSLFCGEWTSESGAAKTPRELPVAYEHIKVNICPQGNQIIELGEGLITQCGPLSLYENLFETDEVITDYLKGDTIMRCTLINSACTEALLHKKREQTRKLLQWSVVSGQMTTITNH